MLLLSNLVLNLGSSQATCRKSSKPQIKLGIGQDKFSYFKIGWTSYKRFCGITDEIEIRDQLRAACHEDLRRNLFSCFGSKMDTPTERQFLDEIEKLAVLFQNLRWSNFSTWSRTERSQ